ncbi:MAG: hypothetical protein LC749_18545 [Actinobacteria bacterium]|nr:hypothetical protein [Actinomycetota bacterium]
MQFPNPTGSSVMDQVNHAVETAEDNYREGMAIAKDAPQMPSAGQQAQGIIDGVMNASPEQLDAMEARLGALDAGDDIRDDVAQSQHDVANRNAAHEIKIAADQEEIHARSVAAAAQAAIDRAKSAS